MRDGELADTARCATFSQRHVLQMWSYLSALCSSVSPVFPLQPSSGNRSPGEALGLQQTR